MKRVDIQILRALCVIVVVLFHTMTRYDHPLIETPLPEWFTSALKICIWIAVPMFLFISGLLFSSQLKCGRYGSWTALCTEKAKHLLIPYAIFTILIMLSSGFFDIGEIVKGGFWHLWFLPAIFFCFITFYPVFYRINSVTFEIGILAIAFGLSFIKIPKEFCFVGYDGMLKWGFYFLLGLIIGNHEREFRNTMLRYHLWILLISLWVIDNIFTSTPYMTVTWHNTLGVGCAITALFYLSSYIKIQGKLLRLVELFSGASMGIYILHYWILIYATSSTAFRLYGVFAHVHEIYAVCVSIIISAIVVLLSYYIARTLQSNKFTQSIIG